MSKTRTESGPRVRARLSAASLSKTQEHGTAVQPHDALARQVLRPALEALHTRRIDARGRGSTLKIYEGAPHGLTVTHTNRFNADLPEFIRGTGRASDAARYGAERSERRHA